MNSLNEKQIEAVESLEGYVLVLAGAGTGKTRVLTTRIIRILEKQLTISKHILAVTFTNKAANEMRLRLQQDGVDIAWLGTFHSLCLKILRSNYEKAGLPSSFSVIDSDDQLRLITKLFKSERIDPKQYSPKSMLYNIRKWKDKNVLPDRLDNSMEKSEIIHFYKIYQERLESLGNVDFGDLIAKCIRLFETYVPVLSYYQDLFHYILVDEYQDTNAAQYIWLKMLSGHHGNLCCVGDDDQSIYGWRGAEVGNILKFEEEFKKVKIIRLEQNYRSKGNILKAASSLISNNQRRLGKELWTDADLGEKVIIQETKNDAYESKYIANQIVELNKKYALNEMAILVRAGFQTRNFEERLLSMGIAYKIVGGLRFYERQEIKDAIAYSKLLLFEEDEMSFERIVNVPKRGIGVAAMQTFHKMAREQNISIVKAAEIYSSSKGHSKLKHFFLNMKKFRALLSIENQEKDHHQKIMDMLLEEFGYIEYLKKDDTLESQGRIENLKEFIKAVGEFGSIQTMLEHVHLISENSLDSTNAVNIMTIHGSKGLEFQVVLLPGWEDGIFPSAKAISQKGQEGLEEERRLAYVALSRARTKAIITYTYQRKQRNIYLPATPSRFIDELAKEYIQHNKILVIDHLVRNPKIGESVNHKHFGNGIVIGAEGNKILVDFDEVGTKRIFSEFLDKMVSKE